MMEATLKIRGIAVPPNIVDLRKEATKVAIEVVGEETEYRAEAGRKFNLTFAPQVRKQTIIRPDKELLLGMGTSNGDEAKEIYDGATRQPLFETLAGYAERTPGLGFTSSFGKGLPEYLEMAEVIRGHTRKAIDRALQEL
jgi:hypothetical protein